MFRGLNLARNLKSPRVQFGIDEELKKKEEEEENQFEKETGIEAERITQCVNEKCKGKSDINSLKYKECEKECEYEGKDWSNGYVGGKKSKKTMKRKSNKKKAKKSKTKKAKKSKTKKNKKAKKSKTKKSRRGRSRRRR